MEKLTLFFLVLTILGASAIEVLDTPHWVSGVVWQDWNSNNVRDGNEPPFPFVKVTLLAQTSSSLRLFTGSPQLVEIQTAFTGVDGSYRFSCLSPGEYAVRFYIPENRPSRFAEFQAGNDRSIDSDVFTHDDRTGQTALFLAESGGASHIDLGLQQYVFINQFSLTGDQWVPSAPDTARGVIYVALNTDYNQLYYRVVRGEFPGTVKDTEGGFYSGWAGENGPQLRHFADRFSPKENVWLNITDAVLSDLFMGKVYVAILGEGAFSSLARMRGQFYHFRNARQLSLVAPLTGRNVVPSVQTSISGSVDVQYNLDSGAFTYRLNFTGLDTSQIQSIGVYGPADSSSTGPLLLALNNTRDQSTTNVSSIANFDNYFSSSRLYVQVNTAQNPNGLLRANLQSAQPSVFHSVFNLTNVGPSRIARAEAVFTIDWRRAELYYYVYIEGVYQDEISTQLHNNRTGGFLTLDGPVALSHENTVKQGYFFAINQDYLNDLYTGKIRIVVETKGGIELIGTLQNWF